MLTIETLTTLSELEALTPEWRALLQTISLRTPSKSPLWQLTWWRHFGSLRSLVNRHEMRVFVLREASGELVAVAPMMITHRPGIGPSLFRELQFFGADPYVTQLRGPVCQRDRLTEVSRILTAHAQAEKTYDFVQWRGMAPGFCGETDKRRVRQAQLDDVDSYLPMRENYAAFLAALPKKTRKHLRKSQNDLRSAGVHYQFRVATTPEETAAGLQRFFELHAQRAALKDVAQHPNVFDCNVSRDFLIDYCGQMARAGELRLFEIRVENRIVATRIGFALGDELYLYFSGYDPAYGPYSIMTTLIAETLQWAHENGVAIVNLSSGVDRSKTRFRPQMIGAEGFYSLNETLRGRLAFPLMQRLRYGKAGPIEVEAPEEGGEELAQA
jgi:CelD/BcsL family acetyltransferase involved in cellulose biosynthesis